MSKRYRWFRHPKTTQERERNNRREDRDFVRGKRRHLPTAWDDIPIPYKKHPSWKRLRRTQYKEQ